MSFDLACTVADPAVTVDERHQDCACKGLIVSLPDGALHLFAERPEDFEALGWAILGAVEALRGQRG